MVQNISFHSRFGFACSGIAGGLRHVFKRNPRLTPYIIFFITGISGLPPLPDVEAIALKVDCDCLRRQGRTSTFLFERPCSRFPPFPAIKSTI